MIAVFIISFAPISNLQRHRMITIQEMTCKVPLCSFYVEAFLLISFAFSLKYIYEVDINPREIRSFENKGDVIIKGFIGLCLFLTGQLLYLFIVNLLRYEFRRQCHEQVKEEEEEESDEPDHYLHHEHSSIIRPNLMFEDSIDSPSINNQQQAQSNNKKDPTILEDELNHIIIGPILERTKQVKISVIIIGLLFLLTIIYLLLYPFLLCKYRGIIAPSITKLKDSKYHHGEPNIYLNLYDATTQLELDLIPLKFSRYYTIAAIIILIINPIIVCLLCMGNVLIPDRLTKPRKLICELIETLQCWCGCEALVIATIFLIPNMELITKFVFDASDACKDVDNYEGQECLVVSCHFINITSTIALFAYAVLLNILCRFNAYELHGGYGTWDPNYIKNNYGYTDTPLAIYH
mmetsp:Transcript_43475/g.55826  ORF Transcript_43475/g.55826 Transcript_43475/m.55826 type:complete len:407 (-) Transcript_43475:270-1490(-)